MPEERFRFIDLAVRPLPPGGGPSELARGELMDRLAHARPAAGDDTLAEATARLQKVSFRKFGLLAIGGLCLLVAVLVPVMKSARLELIRLNPVSPQLPYDVGVRAEIRGTDRGGPQQGRAAFPAGEHENERGCRRLALAGIARR